MPKLIIVSGRSFAGKTTLAGLMARRFGYPEVDVDVTKTDLFGAVADERALTGADWQRIYRETDALIEHHLDAGRSVVDASRNFTLSERKHAGRIAAAHNADLVTIHVDTPASVTRARLLANRQTNERRDVSDENFEALLNGWEPPTEAEHPLVLAFPTDAAAWLERNAPVLGDSRPLGT